MCLSAFQNPLRIEVGKVLMDRGDRDNVLARLLHVAPFFKVRHNCSELFIVDVMI